MTTPHTVPGRVSIVIPAYNCAATVAATVESCLAQTHPDVEIIVVNDGSTDATAQVLAGFGASIRVLDKRNGGVAASRNVGTRAATGEFILWMDHDDLMQPERAALQVAVLRADAALRLASSDFSAFSNPSADFEASHIASYYSAVHRLGGIDRLYTDSHWFDHAGKPWRVRSGDIYEHLISGNFVHPPTVMVRREAFDRVGYFDESLTYNSEYDLIFRIARTGRVAYVDAALLRYRRSETQLSHGTAGGRIPLETVRVLERVRREDPETYARRRALFRHRLAVQYTDAADLIGPSDRLRALRLLAKGLGCELLPLPAMHALARIVTPRFMVVAAKRVWRAVAAAAPVVLPIPWADDLPAAAELQSLLSLLG